MDPRSPATASDTAQNAILENLDKAMDLASADPAPQKRSSLCPPDRAKLGRHTWTFLHTLASSYPESPSESQQSDMKSFIFLFSKMYPCNHCAEHLRNSMEEIPPKVESRNELGLWFCDIHNQINELLGKKLFNCSKLEDRWGKGPADGSCDF